MAKWEKNGLLASTPFSLLYLYQRTNCEGLGSWIGTSHAQSAWGSRAERVRVLRLDAYFYCFQKNYQNTNSLLSCVDG